MKYYDIAKLVDQANLAATDIFEESDLLEIGAEVVEDYGVDENSRKNYMDEYEKWMDLANQVCKVKTTPWQNASNIKYPLIIEAAIQYNARAYPALLSSSRPVQASVVGEDPDMSKAASGARVSKHMSYQLKKQMTEWEPEFDQMLLVKAILGCMFKKVYYSGKRRRNYSEVVYPSELVINYNTKWEDCDRKTHIKEYTKNEILSEQRRGNFLDVELGDPLIRDNESKITDTTPYIVLEQHKRLDLDGDGYSEPYLVTVEKESKKVLRIVANYDASSIEYNQNAEVVNVYEIEEWVKYTFIPSIDGSPYDLGLGRLIGPLSESIDTNINMLTDAGHMANTGGGFISRRARLKAGDNRFKPNEWKQILGGENIKNMIFPLPIREPSGVLFNLLGMLITQAQRIAGTVDSMVGENPGQNQKATTTVEVMREGRKVANAIHKRTWRSLEREFQLLYKLNAQNEDIDGYFTVLDTRESEEIYNKDYNVDSLDICPTADPDVSSSAERIQKAQAALQLASQGLVNMEVARQMMVEALELPHQEALLEMPEQGPSPEQLEMEHQQKMDQLNYQLEVLKEEREAQKTEVEMIKLLAEAEGIEPGRQMEAYKAILDDMQKNRQLDIQESQRAQQNETRERTD